MRALSFVVTAHRTVYAVEPRMTNANNSQKLWLVLLAAFLGWMFDGLEMGIFPLVARPALQQFQLAGGIMDEQFVQLWMGRITATFLLGAAAGGLVFGWLGDRIGRVRAMTMSVLAYSLFTGLNYFAQAPWHLAVFRFIAALGMGGEWSLGVALVMEAWPRDKRPLMAGVIGAAANVGYAVIALIGIFFDITKESWRWVMLVGAAPALITLLIVYFVPESERWKESVETKGLAHPLSEIFAPKLVRNTVLAILFASVALIVTWGIVQWLPLWADQMSAAKLQSRQEAISTALSAAAKSAPASNPLAEAGKASADALDKLRRGKAKDAVGDMAKAQTLLEQAGFADLAREQASLLHATQEQPKVKSRIQLVSSIGAIIGCLIAPLVGAMFGRRPVYFGLCLGSLIVCSILFRGFSEYGAAFLAMVGVVGAFTAAFYGWLPQYLPELFPTRVRATGQGVAFNSGRILAAVGAWQMGAIMGWFDKSYARAGAAIVFVYLAGMALIWLAPETRGKPLPE
jgi:MFS family permease